MPVEAGGDIVRSMSAAYCAVTAGSDDSLQDVETAIEWPALTSLKSILASQGSTATFSDPLVSKTAVSLYFTGQASGSAAFAATVPAGSAIPSNHVFDGQIVPTLSPTSTTITESNQNPGGILVSILAHPPTTAATSSVTVTTSSSEQNAESVLASALSTFSESATSLTSSKGPITTSANVLPRRDVPASSMAAEQQELF